jgi:hypothetical protein
MEQPSERSQRPLLPAPPLIALTNDKVENEVIGLYVTLKKSTQN